MREYEFMFIFKPQLEKIPSLKETVKAYITDAGGKITREEDMGMRELAYNIQKQSQGFYYLLYCELDPNKINEEIDREIKLNEDILRYMPVRLTKI